MAKEFSNLNALKLFLLPSPQLHSHDTSDNNCWLGPLWALGHESFLVSQITPWHICVIWPSLTIHLLSTSMQFSNHEIIPKSNFIYFWFLDFSNWIWPILHPRIVWWKCLNQLEATWIGCSTAHQDFLWVFCALTVFGCFQTGYLGGGISLETAFVASLEFLMRSTHREMCRC